MSIQLPVPFFPQLNSMSCWWAGMRMVLAHHRQPHPMEPGDYRNQLRSIYSPRPRSTFERQRDPREWYRFGVPPDRIPDLAGITGFALLIDVPSEWNEQTVTDTLNRHGPFLFLGRFGAGDQSINHVFVVIGSAADHCLVHDPFRGPSIRESYDWLNQRTQTYATSAIADRRGFPVLYFGS